jgi:hypothetical protein
MVRETILETGERHGVVQLGLGSETLRHDHDRCDVVYSICYSDSHG